MSSKYPVYVSPGHKWDSDKYPYSNNDRKGEKGKYTDEFSEFLNYLDGATCANLSIAPDLQSMVFAKADVRLDIEIRNITSIDRLGNMLQINSEDEVPYFVNFINATEQMNAENRLFAVMNGDADPGCGYGNGDFNNFDFSADFS